MVNNYLWFDTLNWTKEDGQVRIKELTSFKDFLCPYIIYSSKIDESFIEPGFEDNCENDPYEMSSPQVILEDLKENEKMAG